MINKKITEQSSIEILNELREFLGLPRQPKAFVDSEFVENLLKEINPDFNLSEKTLDNKLVDGIPNWIDQVTVPHQPDKANVLNMRHQLLSSTTKKSLVRLEPKTIVGYHHDIRQQLQSLGFSDPMTDNDERIIKAWKEIEKRDPEMTISVAHDFKGTLMDHDDPKFKLGQSRATSEDIEKVSRFTDQFYFDGVPMYKIPIAVILPNKNGEDKLVPAFGNHRCRSHARGQTLGYDSLGSVLIVGNSLSIQERERLLLLLSTISNEDTRDSTQPENREDLIHQVKTHFDYESLYDPALSKLDEVGQIQWAKKWLVDNKPNYGTRSMAAVVTRIANDAFSSHVSQSIPMPDDKAQQESAIDASWKKFFPNSFWSPDQSPTVDQWLTNTNGTQLELKQVRVWRNQPPENKVAKTVWLSTRVGDKMTSNCTRPAVINSGRKSWIKFVTKLNNDPKFATAGFPFFQRVVFVKQIEALDETAFEWNYQSSSFDPVSKK
tara:strand:+ start:44 stop:1519 length:1476 start_codon:yes stop_codon:yes gene_type:complete